jgi:4-amino-4-deoxy-L-arabinose transferase-like glycosyltransferase
MNKRTWLPWYLALLLVGCLLRVGLWFVYSPRHTSDLQGYLTVAQMVLHMDFSHNEGARPPVYPALLVVTGLSEHGTWILQMGLGLLISTLLFVFTWQLIRNAPLAFLAALLYSLNLAQLFFEATMLAETLSTFFLLLALGLVAVIKPQTKGSGLFSILLGTTLGLAVLNRPMYIYLCPLFFIYLYWRWRQERSRSRWCMLAGFVLPAMGIILGWSTVNWFTTGYFGPTTMTGYYLMNHTGNFIEYAPDQFAVVRDIYLRHRAEQIATTGNQAMTVWRSWNDLTDATGLSYAGLSRLLTDLSLTLIIQHPWLYLQSAAISWSIFWKVANFWDLDLIRMPALIPWLDLIWQAERYLIIVVNIVFILMGLAWTWRWIKRRLTADEIPLFLIWMLVMGGAFFQAFLERGDNARYAVSFEVMVIWAVLVGLWQMGTMIGFKRVLPPYTPASGHTTCQSTSAQK